MALVPQPPVPPFSTPRSSGSDAPGPFWLGVAAVVLAVAGPIAAVCREIAARWRGIVIAHLFFLTLWMAIQVFFFAIGAYWCVPGNGPKFAQWLLRSVPRVARCGPVRPLAPLPLSPVVATPAPLPLEPATPEPVPVPAPAVIPPAVAPPAVVPAAPPPVVAQVQAQTQTQAAQTQAQAATPVPAATVAPAAAAAAPAPAPAAAVQPAADSTPTTPTTPALGTPLLPPARWSATTAAVPAASTPSRWSAAAIPNCWRDRGVTGGNCYQADGAVPRRTAPSRTRSRTPAYARRRPTSEQCRRRPWECWPDGYGDYF